MSWLFIHPVNSNGLPGIGQTYYEGDGVGLGVEESRVVGAATPGAASHPRWRQKWLITFPDLQRTLRTFLAALHCCVAADIRRVQAQLDRVAIEHET